MKKIKTIRISKIFYFIIVFVFLCLIYKLIYVGTGHIYVKGRTLSDFAKDRDTTKKTLVARRGTIYSSGREVLAKDVNSYTVIAYLEPSRTKDPKRPYHVVDNEYTAEKLAPLINMKKETIIGLLNSNIKTCDENGKNCKSTVPYQVELGPGGRGITELLKDEIDALDLPGIDFIASSKRYYPNGEFLSYSLGYARRNDSGDYVGEMGIEQYYNDELTGTNGYIEYQRDLYGYQITSTPTIEKKAISGNDIYLTIDTNIQMFAEQAREKLEESGLEWATVSVMDAKTGAILGVSSSPSFNNNTLNIKSYYDPFVASTYEPGSTMKIFSFMSAMEAGIYNGKDKYKSGRLKVDDALIKDWNYYGWGTITFDEGFMGSSNVAASKLGLKLGRAKLKDYYNSLGFGTKTDIGLPNESYGIINFRYNTEVASASFGQGITVTAVQMLQALTTLSNDGVMIKPYIVKKIVDSEGNVILENERTEVRKVFSKETTNAMRKLMRGVVDGSARMSTGTGYYIKGYDLIGKTGTAQIASKKGGYLKGSTNYVKSFAGLFPGNDPQVIVYIAVSKLKKSNDLKKATKNLVRNVGTYLNLYDKSNNKGETAVYTTKMYINKNTQEVKEEITNSKLKPIVLGDGSKVIKQYPESNKTLNVGNKIFLKTNSNEYKMPDIKGWSRNEVETMCKLLDLDVAFDGYGYVTKYSIEKDTIIDFSDTLEVTLETKYKEETKEKDTKKETNKKN